jgi:hypothetical protein
MANRVTAAELIRALKGDGTLEGLARRIDVPLRTVQRWSHMNDPDNGPQWRYMSRLLADAGWITDGDQPVIDQLEQLSVEDRLEELAELVARGFSALGVTLNQPQQSEVAPSRRGNGGG